MGLDRRFVTVDALLGACAADAARSGCASRYFVSGGNEVENESGGGGRRGRSLYFCDARS